MDTTIDRTIVWKADIAERHTDFAYWQTRPPEERLATLESIRREYHGWSHDSQPRLQRVYRVVKHS